MSVQMLPQIKKIHGMEGFQPLRPPVYTTLYFFPFFPARRYASAGNSDRNVSVCLSVRHAPVLCQNEES